VLPLPAFGTTPGFGKQVATLQLLQFLFEVHSVDDRGQELLRPLVDPTANAGIIDCGRKASEAGWEREEKALRE